MSDLSDLSDLSERTILLTGATDGLGRALAERWAAAGARLLLHGRDPDKLAATVEELRGRTGSERLSTHLADLADLAAARRLAREVADATDRLDVLVNNAGVNSKQRVVTEAGTELTFTVNYLAPVLLTRELLPLLRASAPARIVNVASVGQAPVSFDDHTLSDGYERQRAYGQSKLAMIAWTFDLAEELRGSGVTANALHPATLMPTKMVRENYSSTVDSLDTGIEATARLVEADDLADVTGEFFDRQRPARAMDQAYDAAARARLRALTDELLASAA